MPSSVAAVAPVSRNPLPQALAPALSLVARERFTGSVVATRGPLQKRLALNDGEIVFAASNDARDRIGQALLRARLITESDLVEALQTVTEGAGPRLAAALAAMRKVTPEECAFVFEANMRECVLDIFLWPAGSLQITRGSLGKPDAPYPMRMQVEPVLVEGRRRRERWKVVERLLPDPDTSFERKESWPSGFPATEGDKALANLVEGGRTLGEILLELHGQDYSIKVRLASLVEHRILATRTGRPVPAPKPDSQPEHGVLVRAGVSEMQRGEFTRFGALPTPPKASNIEANDLLAHAADLVAARELAGDLLAHAAALLATGELAKARDVLDGLIQKDPLANPEAWALLQKVEVETVRAAVAGGLSDKAVLALVIPLDQLASRTFSPAESFLVSRFAAGPSAIGAVKAVCPFPPHELLCTLQKLIDQGVLRQRR